jgi:hypothetical protein
VCTEASAALRAEAADFFINRWCLLSIQITVFSTNQGASTIMHKAFDWKSSMISLLKVEPIPQNCIPQTLTGLGIVTQTHTHTHICIYMRIFMTVECFDLRRGN